MSGYKWSDPESWDTFCYVKKGEEKLGFFQTYLELEALERQLKEEKAKSKALLVGLEVQNLDDFINRANLKNYKELGENITIGFKTQLKEQGE